MKINQMKTLIFSSLICLISILVACQPDTNPLSKNIANISYHSLITKDTISIQKFNRWKEEWEQNGKQYQDTAQLFQYFTMPITALAAVINEKSSGSKFYFGLEKLNVKDTSEIETSEKFMLKFMLVGTDVNGNDLIDYENQLYIYDFSKLCPPICE